MSLNINLIFLHVATCFTTDQEWSNDFTVQVPTFLCLNLLLERNLYLRNFFLVQMRNYVGCVNKAWMYAYIVCAEKPLRLIVYLTLLVSNCVCACEWQHAGHWKYTLKFNSGSFSATFCSNFVKFFAHESKNWNLETFNGEINSKILG